MKKIITLLSFSFLLFAGIGNLNAQEQEISREQIHKESKEMAYQIVQEMGLDSDKLVPLQRVIATKELGMMKLNHSFEQDSELYAEYKTQVDEEFVQNSKHALGEDSYKDFLVLYKKMDKK
ncbi:hypothetical protein [Psychroflexus aestuariivivens]|uniref:hypothetical protein n=1 Tax=Psychroflexus aestuariivivens TaxID=1795040 RepID=UPI000FD8CB66|nr:hypothetical protein [Psychroflexus aestuariivivens]